jgi:hypothetical protein
MMHRYVLEFFSEMYTGQHQELHVAECDGDYLAYKARRQRHRRRVLIGRMTG